MVIISELVNLQMQANAIKAKQRSRIRSPNFPPSKKFWRLPHHVPSSSSVPKVPGASSGNSSVFTRLGGVAKSDVTDGTDGIQKKKSQVCKEVEERLGRSTICSSE